MFVRFEVEQMHPESHRQVGALHALRYLRDDGELSPHELARAEQIFTWLAQNLASPIRFRRSTNPRGPNRAVSWFRESASEHIRLMREVAAILEEHGIRVRVITTSKPGYVVHEDRYQVVAEPFTDTFA